jgi:hypothetical protein
VTFFSLFANFSTLRSSLATRFLLFTPIPTCPHFEYACESVDYANGD